MNFVFSSAVAAAPDYCRHVLFSACLRKFGIPAYASRNCGNAVLKNVR
jgi:hypothetical protein